MSARILPTSIFLAAATRAAWYAAAAGLMFASSPLPDAVTKSTGTRRTLAGSAARSASMRALAASVSAEFVGPRFDPDELAALYGNGLESTSVVAESLPQKNLGS